MKLSSADGGSVGETFQLAVDLVRCLPQSGPFQPSYSDAAKVYSYFKQAKFGPCTEAKPWSWDVIKKAKWVAWTALGNMTREKAMENYVEEVTQMVLKALGSEGFDEQLQQNVAVVGPKMIAFCRAVGIPVSPAVEAWSLSQNIDNSTPLKSQFKSRATESSVHDEEDMTMDSLLKQKMYESFAVDVPPDVKSIDESSPERTEGVGRIQIGSDRADKCRLEDESSDDDNYCDPIPPESVVRLEQLQRDTVDSCTGTDSSSTLAGIVSCRTGAMVAEEAINPSSSYILSASPDRSTSAVGNRDEADRLESWSGSDNGDSSVEILTPCDMPKKVDRAEVYRPLIIEKKVDVAQQSPERLRTRGNVFPVESPSCTCPCAIGGLLNESTNSPQKARGTHVSEKHSEKACLCSLTTAHDMSCINMKIFRAVCQMESDLQLMRDRMASMENQIKAAFQVIWQEQLLLSGSRAGVDGRSLRKIDRLVTVASRCEFVLPTMHPQEELSAVLTTMVSSQTASARDLGPIFKNTSGKSAALRSRQSSY